MLDADPRRVKRVRISRLTEKRQKPRETGREPPAEPVREPARKRAEPDAVLAGHAPPTLNLDEPPPQKEEIAKPAAVSTGKRRP